MKVFMPKSILNIRKNCDLYGDFKDINEQKTEAFYVVEAVEHGSNAGDVVDSKLRRIGQIVDSKINKQNGPLCFCYDNETSNIYLKEKDKAPLQNVNIYLYEPSEFMQIDDNTAPPADDITNLRLLLFGAQNIQHRRLTIGALLLGFLNLPLHLMTSLFILVMESKFISTLLRRTAFYEHYKEWRKFHSSGKRNWNLALDKLLGILVMVILLFYLHEPGEYVITASHFVIDKLRLLLRSLKGSPIGLKLNVHLNNFFLDCFNYHIDLWATFLNIIEPSIQQLFVPITLLGSMGLSCQLALLSDLLSIVGLHAHCFYIYAAVLYKVEIRGLSVLWKVVRGKRYNLLSKRVESHNYMNRQLYLATIFFTSLLFLFPTILVYYVVFTTLRLCTYTVNWLLKTVRRRILEFPLQKLYEWLHGNYKDRDGIHIQHNNYSLPLHTNKGQKSFVSVFSLNVQPSSFGRIFLCKSGVLQELKTNEDLTLKNLCKRILEGKF